jgi:hypothetical protein
MAAGLKEWHPAMNPKTIYTKRCRSNIPVKVYCSRPLSEAILSIDSNEIHYSNKA